MSGDAHSLLGTEVAHRAIVLGHVAAVLTDHAGAVLGFEVESAWGAEPRFLPAPAAAIADNAIEASPHALLSIGVAAFYELRGAVRVTPTPSLRPY